MKVNKVGGAGKNAIVASQPGGPGGNASALNPGNGVDASNTATATGGAGGGGGWGLHNSDGIGGAAGAGGKGGTATAQATTLLSIAGSISSIARAIGGAGGESGLPGNYHSGAMGPGANGGGGGNATATATAINAIGTAYASAYTLAGSGGASAGPGQIGGAGGAATGTKATASGTSATAKAIQIGGDGGSGRVGAIGQSASGSTLSNAVSGTTTGGNLSLHQVATGGWGGHSELSDRGEGDQIGGSGGVGVSTLVFNDLTANKISASKLTAYVEANGGNGGAGGTVSGTGADSTASVSLTGAHIVEAESKAHGGTGGKIGSPGQGGGGGNATASARAETTSISKSAHAFAGAYGGGGGIGRGHGDGRGGAGGIATNTTAWASGRSAYAGVRQRGGQGGDGEYGANGGAGAASVLINAVSGRTTGGTLDLSQLAEGGAGGFSDSGSGGPSGYAKSELTFNDATENDTRASVLIGYSRASGGYGGYGRVGATAAPSDGAAVASTTLVGTGKIYATAQAHGGGGTRASTGIGGAGGAATASASALTYSLSETASADAFAIAGTGGRGVGGGAGGIASNTTAKASGFSATARAWQIGGQGGTGYAGKNGGAGTTSNLTNAVTGTTTGGNLSLVQRAEGGNGGHSAKVGNSAGVGGIAGAAISHLSFDDAATNKVSAVALVGDSVAEGGNGGTGRIAAKGGAATGSSVLTGAHAVISRVNADGGHGGNVTDGFSGVGGIGGTATAFASANTSSIAEEAVAEARSVGGEGGRGAGAGKSGGAGGIANNTAARGTGRSVTAIVEQRGGNGGAGLYAANGGAGAASTLKNAVSGSTTGGDLALRQNAVGGAGGYSDSGTGGLGGAATSNLTFNDETANSVDAANTYGRSAATGGAGGGSATSGAGKGGAATSSVVLTGVNNVTAMGYAFGGRGGYLAGDLSGNGGNAIALSSAIATKASGYTFATAKAFADGGAGVIGGTASATALAKTAAGQLAIAFSQAAGRIGQAQSTAITGTSGLVTGVSSMAQSQVGSTATADSRANANAASFDFADSPINSFSYATALPNVGSITSVLTGNAKVNTIFNTPLATVLAAGMQGANYASDAVGNRTYKSTVTWSLDTTTLSGDLIVGLLDFQSLGTGFASLTFNVTIEGSSVLTKAFNSAGLTKAQTFFDNNTINLGDVAQDADLTVAINYTLVSNAVGSGFGISYLLGTTNDEIDITPPAAPSTPDLVALADTGESNADNITSTNVPTFSGKAEANATVNLFDGVTSIGNVKADTTGSWTITSGKALADGVHSITAKAADAAGNVSVSSSALSVSIDTTSPLQPTGLDLQAASDSGASQSDNITNVTTPIILGKGEVGTTVTLLRGAVILGVAKVNASGNWAIRTTALPDGLHVLRARQTDVAGNVSSLSTTLTVTVDSVAPIAPVLGKVTTTLASGVAEANMTIALFDGLTQIGSITANEVGSWSIPIALGTGTHTLKATATDLAGNSSPDSNASNVVVGTAGPDFLFAAGSDLSLGGAGNDIYLVDDPADAATEAVGEGFDTVYASVGYTLPTGSEIEFLIANAGTADVTLAGNELANSIFGGGGDDTIVGMGGADMLSGGGGADIFALLALADSTVDPAGRDTVGDFSAIAGDLIGLSALDANTGLGGDQAFAFIGAAAFSGVGQVRAEVVGGNTVVSGNVNAALGADFAITLTGSHALTGANFIL